MRGTVLADLPDSDPSQPSATEPADLAIVGGGAAGLHVALEAAEAGGRVVVISRKPLTETASFRAQGGLAAAIAPDDSPARHAEDTLNAGRGLCDPAAVQVLVDEAPAAVAALREPRGRVRPAARRIPLARPRRRALGTPDRPRRGSGDRPGADQQARAAGRRARADRGARGRLGARPLVRRAALRRRPHRSRRRAGRSDGPGDRRRGRPLAANDEPAGGDRRRSRARARRRRRPRRPRALPVPSDGARPPRRRARRLADHRGGPRRGRAAPRRRRPPVHGRARPPRPGHRGDPRPDGRRRRPARSTSTCDRYRWSDSRRSPEPCDRSASTPRPSRSRSPPPRIT